MLIKYPNSNVIEIVLGASNFKASRVNTFYT